MSTLTPKAFFFFWRRRTATVSERAMTASTDILDPLQIATESRAVSDGLDIFSFVKPADRGLIQTISIVVDNAALFAQQGSYGVAV